MNSLGGQTSIIKMKNENTDRIAHLFLDLYRALEPRITKGPKMDSTSISSADEGWDEIVTEITIGQLTAFFTPINEAGEKGISMATLEKMPLLTGLNIYARLPWWGNAPFRESPIQITLAPLPKTKWGSGSTFVDQLWNMRGRKQDGILTWKYPSLSVDEAVEQYMREEIVE